MSQDSSKDVIDILKHVLFKADQLGIYSEEIVFDLPHRKIIVKLEARHGEEVKGIRNERTEKGQLQDSGESESPKEKL